MSQPACGAQHVRLDRQWVTFEMLARDVQPLLGFAQLDLTNPQRPGQGRREPGHGLRVATRRRPFERGTEVLALWGNQSGCWASIREPVKRFGLQQLDEPMGVEAPQLARLAGFIELLERVLAQRLEHPVAPAVDSDKTAVDERLQRV